jgi:hypothetical protein
MSHPVDDQSITRVSSTKFLGVHIDENLTWKEHVTYNLQENIKKYRYYLSCPACLATPYTCQSVLYFNIPLHVLLQYCVGLYVPKSTNHFDDLAKASHANYK